MSTQQMIIIGAVLVVAFLIIFGRSDPSRTSRIDPSKIQLGPIRHDTLPESLVVRIRELTRVFADVYPRSMDEWIEGFKRDLEPEREIAIWEAMGAAYSSFTADRALSIEAKQEALGFLLQRSAGDVQSLLASATPKHLTRSEVAELVRLYSVEPQPVRVISE